MKFIFLQVNILGKNTFYTKLEGEKINSSSYIILHIFLIIVYIKIAVM